MGNWGNLRLRQELINNLMEFLSTEKGKKLGYSSASQLAEYVLRNYLNNPNTDLHHKYASEVNGLTEQVKKLLDYFEETKEERVEKNKQMKLKKKYRV